MWLLETRSHETSQSQNWPCHLTVQQCHLENTSTLPLKLLKHTVIPAEHAFWTEIRETSWNLNLWNLGWNIPTSVKIKGFFHSTIFTHHLHHDLFGWGLTLAFQFIERLQKISAGKFQNLLPINRFLHPRQLGKFAAVAVTCKPEPGKIWKQQKSAKFSHGTPKNGSLKMILLLISINYMAILRFVKLRGCNLF